MNMEVPEGHPRAESLRIREKLIRGFEMGVVAKAGLIAHGRGEAFDYIIGEETIEPAMNAIRAAVALMLTAEHPVISVNGNTAALVPKEIVELAKLVNAKIEVNIFYHSPERVNAIRRLLEDAGAEEILGIDDQYKTTIPEISSMRRYVDVRGIYKADVVLVPLEDGDRTEALVKLGKKVIAIDLNPLSRTAQWATITIVDNIVRCVPLMCDIARELRGRDRQELGRIVEKFDNRENLKLVIRHILERLSELSKKGIYLPEVSEVFKEMRE